MLHLQPVTAICVCARQLAVIYGPGPWFQYPLLLNGCRHGTERALQRNSFCSGKSQLRRSSRPIGWTPPTMPWRQRFKRLSRRLEKLLQPSRESEVALLLRQICLVPLHLMSAITGWIVTGKYLRNKNLYGIFYSTWTMKGYHYTITN